VYFFRIGTVAGGLGASGAFAVELGAGLSRRFWGGAFDLSGALWGADVGGPDAAEVTGSGAPGAMVGTIVGDAVASARAAFGTTSAVSRALAGEAAVSGREA
jgi:hypothetical protein